MARRKDGPEFDRNDVTVRVMLDGMEPDLHLLQGFVSVLRSLSETTDGAEPVALEAIAYGAGETPERVMSGWRGACNDLRRR